MLKDFFTIIFTSHFIARVRKGCLRVACERMLETKHKLPILTPLLWPSRLSIIWKSDLTDKMKRSFFQAAVVSILLYGCTTWTLTKRLERRLDGNYTRMLRAVLNKSWRQHPTRLQLYGHLPPITKTIQVRRTRHAGHCWRSKDELISDVLLWTPTYGCASVGRPARTYIQQLCEDTGCNPEDLPEAMNDREKWRERVKDIRAGGATWWWWCYDRHVVSFLFSWCWGQLHQGFPRAPSVGCGFHYHIWSLAVWESAGNYSGTQTQLS